MSNVVYPAYLELSRLQFFKAVGDPEPGDFAFQHVAAELTLRYLAACYYDEALAVYSKLTSIGSSSAVMEQAVTGPDRTLRAISRVSVVRFQSGHALPWTDMQRAGLTAHHAISQWRPA